MNNEHEWTLDEYGTLNLRKGRAHVWIEQRPPYCDRGHFIANVMGIPTIDHQDAFPRYYMRLDVAKQEMAEWLDWRLKREREG